MIPKVYSPGDVLPVTAATIVEKDRFIDTCLDFHYVDAGVDALSSFYTEALGSTSYPTTVLNKALDVIRVKRDNASRIFIRDILQLTSPTFILKVTEPPFLGEAYQMTLLWRFTLPSRMSKLLPATAHPSEIGTVFVEGMKEGPVFVYYDYNPASCNLITVRFVRFYTTTYKDAFLPLIQAVKLVEAWSENCVEGCIFPLTASDVYQLLSLS